LATLALDAHQIGFDCVTNFTNCTKQLVGVSTKGQTPPFWLVAQPWNSAAHGDKS
jgi:hypothetical protein